MKTCFAVVVLTIIVMLGMPAVAQAVDADWAALDRTNSRK